jgi:hypothetical protein
MKLNKASFCVRFAKAQNTAIRVEIRQFESLFTFRLLKKGPIVTSIKKKIAYAGIRT